MLANHCFEVGLEKRTLRRCKSIKLRTSEEISALRNVRRGTQFKVCNLYTRKNVRKLTTSAEITTSQVHDANYVGRKNLKKFRR